MVGSRVNILWFVCSVNVHSLGSDKHTDTSHLPRNDGRIGDTSTPGLILINYMFEFCAR